jgi:hypothetical protein
MPKYFITLEEPDDLTWVYVHEGTHKFADTEDVGDSLSSYLSRESAMGRRGKAQIKYRQPGLRPEDALRNADSYAGLLSSSRGQRGVCTHRL